jgi:Zn-dependent peptidase ImmA (M78 family)/DNA-binding XRE family transcriptional regulator
MANKSLRTRANAFINPAILQWARKRSVLTPEELASKLHVSRERIVSWEAGDTFPTMRQAQSLAHVLAIPIGYLYLSAPPVERLPLPDFRTVGGVGIASAPPELIDLLRDILLKQEWFREFMEEEYAPELPFVGRFNTDTAPKVVAEDIRRVLHIEEDLRAHSENWEQFLRNMILRAEAERILVLRSGVIAGNNDRPIVVDEIRGFAIVDNLAPLVFINGRDSKAAQVFTLAHELAHIWIGQSGISNASLQNPASASSNRIERICNAIAAELLAPESEMRERWSAGRNYEENARELGKLFKVSTLVILRRALDLGLMKRDVYDQAYAKAARQFDRPAEEKKKSGGDYYRTLRVRNSNTLISAVLEAVATNRLLYRDAAQLLNVRVPTIQKLAEQSAGIES